MKYKVGDIVKLRDDLDLYTNYGYGWQCNPSMLELKGQKVTITRAWEKYYDIAEDDGNWGWTDEMIEGLWEECKPKYKLIDILNKIANGELKEGTKIKHGNTNYMWHNRDCFFYDEEDEFIFLDAMKCLSDEVELIEPQEPTECNHIWDNRLISAFSKEKGEIVKMKECRKCGKWEETTDNTKIEELDAYYFGMRDATSKSWELFRKLNEVINKINRGE